MANGSRLIAKDDGIAVLIKTLLPVWANNTTDKLMGTKLTSSQKR
ncbi:hypothetical protein CRENPOLYSF2_3150009 [Crenothrix polyspora]|uniref:Uncharacterized protein n=1 Tax=Crenothrix polyspora TaxID=360316 RepID=A0A1R4HAC8_9GAMM|nr:hypothetical protein CRENPOLYSF2_3150009 [Crenothrix polyspora]